MLAIFISLLIQSVIAFRYPSPLDLVAKAIPFSSVKCPMADQMMALKLRLQGKQLQCASVKVPSNWQNPNGIRIDLFMRRIRPVNPTVDHRIFIIPGGPGQWLSSKRFATIASLFYDSVPAEIITIDHRGTGHSTRLKCGLLEKPFPIKCFQTIARNQPNFGDFSVYNAVMDYIFVIDRLNSKRRLPTTLHGISYGGYLLQRFLQLAPAGLVQRAIIQSSPDLESDMYLSMNHGQVLQKMLDNCHQPGRTCPIPFREASNFLTEIKSRFTYNTVCAKKFKRSIPFLYRLAMSPDELMFGLLTFSMMAPEKVGFQAVLLSWRFVRCDLSLNDDKAGGQLIRSVLPLFKSLNIDLNLNRLILASEIPKTLTADPHRNFNTVTRQFCEINSQLCDLSGMQKEINRITELRSFGLIYNVQTVERLPEIMKYLDVGPANQNRPTSCLFLVGQLDFLSHLAESAYQSATRCDPTSKYFVIDMKGGHRMIMKNHTVRYLRNKLHSNLIISQPRGASEPQESVVHAWPSPQEFNDQSKWYHDTWEKIQ